VLVTVFAAVLLKEKLNIVRKIGFVIAIVGVLLTSLPVAVALFLIPIANYLSIRILPNWRYWYILL
jgi:drug/metabolite transporter (DMT)-like permease